MPIYEYYCVECDLRFDLLRKMSDIDKSASCPSCNNKSNRVPSAFYHFNQPTYIRKKKDNLAEHIMAIETQKEREPHLNWDKHLDGAKREISGERAMKKEIERVAGKGSDAREKYKDIMKTKRAFEKQDRWNTD